MCKLFKNKKMRIPTLVELIYGGLLLCAVLPNVFIWNVKVWYIVIVVSSLYFLYKGNLKIPNCPIYILIIVSIIVSISFGLFSFGIQRQFINYCLALFLVSFSYSFVELLGIEKSEKVMESVAIIFGVIILFNTLVQMDLIYDYLTLRYLKHPEIESVTVGGVNLDATWLAIYCTACYKNKLKYFMLGYSTAISALYNCRVAIILNVLVLFWFLYLDRNNTKKLIRMFCIAIPVSLYFFIKTNIISRVLERFSGIGNANELGSLGRLRMWRNVPKVIINYPFGVGLGNSMRALIKVTGYNYEDANYHNLIMEFFGQIGIVGGIIYLCLIIAFGIYIWKKLKYLNSFDVMVFAYIIAGMVEFSGCESIIFIVIGSMWGVYKSGENKSGLDGVQRT